MKLIFFLMGMEGLTMSLNVAEAAITITVGALAGNDRNESDSNIFLLLLNY